MFLTPAAVFHYLCERGFLTPEEALGNYSAVIRHRRHRTFLVKASESNYAIKQAGAFTEELRDGIAAEAHCYWLAQNDSRFECLRALLPVARSWDPKNSVLVLDLLPLVPLAELDFEHRFDPRRASRIAEAMASVHESTAWIAQDRAILDQFPTLGSTFLSYRDILDESSPDEKTSRGQKDLQSALRKYRGFEAKLDGMRNAWTQRAFVHGDWKTANCLVDTSDANAPVRILDWELAHAGDPIFDCGTLLQSYLYDWAADPEECDLASIRPTLRTFWLSYSSGCVFGTEHGARTRAVQYAGARMLQTAWEELQREPSLTAAAVRLLQASWNILEDPAGAEAVFFDGN